MHPLRDLSFQVTGELCLLYQERRNKDILLQTQYSPSLCHVLTYSSSFMFYIHTHTHSLSVFSFSSSWAMFVIVCIEIPRCLPVPFPLWCSGSEKLCINFSSMTQMLKRVSPLLSLSLSFLWCRRGKTMLVLNAHTFDDTYWGTRVLLLLPNSSGTSGRLKAAFRALKGF